MSANLEATFNQIVVTTGPKLIVVLAVFLVITFSSCQTIYQSGFVPVPVQEISGPITIEPEWIEITPPRPLIPYGAFQRIGLECEGCDKSDWEHDESASTIELADGKITKIEAFLFDDKGQSYELKVYRTSFGPELTRRGEIKWSGRPNFSHPDYSEVKFPADRVFTKLKIRSEIPLKCNKIQWTGENQK